MVLSNPHTVPRCSSLIFGCRKSLQWAGAMSAHGAGRGRSESRGPRWRAGTVVRGFIPLSNPYDFQASATRQQAATGTRV